MAIHKDMLDHSLEFSLPEMTDPQRLNPETDEEHIPTSQIIKTKSIHKIGPIKAKSKENNSHKRNATNSNSRRSTRKKQSWH